MAEQGYGSAPSRNASSAAGIPNKVNVGNVEKTKVTADNTGKSPVQKGPGNAGFSGTSVIPGKIKV